MRELSIRLQFTQPCLGSVKVSRTFTINDSTRKRAYYVFQRGPVDTRVLFMPQRWLKILRDAAEVQCRLQKEIKDVRFSLEVDGTPREIPYGAYKRYWSPECFTPHEQFAAGDVVGVSCLVPDTISTDAFWSLMDTAGEYYGMSPFPIGKRGKFGFFKVVGIQRRGHVSAEESDEAVSFKEVVKTAETK